MSLLFGKRVPWFLRASLTASSVLAGVLFASAFSYGPSHTSLAVGSPVAVAVRAAPDVHSVQLKALAASKQHQDHLNHLGQLKAAAGQARTAVLQAQARKVVKPKPAVRTSAPAVGSPPRTSTTAVASAAPVTYSGGALSASQVGSLWLSAGGPSWAEPKAIEIARCESGFNPRAYNPSGATGLWQILGSVVPGDLTNPSVNAANAVAKFRASGDTFAQWVCT